MVLNPVTGAFLDGLRATLPETCFRPIAPRYLSEPRGFYAGQAGCLLLPSSAGEVALILRHCNAARVGVVPYGGGTGLVGGQVMPKGAPAPVVLSLERLDSIEKPDLQDNTLVVGAGAILADVQAVAAAAARLFPLSLASEGSCRIGGNLASNAGGVQVLRYGNARALCLGLEAVLPEGRIWQGLKRLRKDNTGYDLRDLLIGSEGTLGVITRAVLRLFPQPEQHLTAFLQIRDPRAAIDLLARCQARFGGLVSAFELIDRTGFEFLQETLPSLRRPFAAPGKWMVLLEIGAGTDFPAQTVLESVLEAAFDAGLMHDAVIAQSEAQREAFWAVRERIPEANRLIGAISSHDISVPLGQLPEMIRKGAGVVARFGDLRVNCFGHVGDGNLHYNVYPPKGAHRADFSHLRDDIKRAIHDLVDTLGGSFSAEHGIGRLKRDDLSRYGDPAKLAAMRAIKTALDPNGIMNPGVIFAPS